MRPIIGHEPTHAAVLHIGVGPASRVDSSVAGGRPRTPRAASRRPVRRSVRARSACRRYPPPGEGHPTVHRPHRAAPGPRPARRARAQPALVLGHRDPATCSRASTRRSGTRSGGDPVQLLGALGPERLAALAADPASSAGSRPPPTTCAPTSRATAGTRAWPRQPPARTTPSRRRSPTSRPEFGITAALPQYSGGLGILAGDHLKAASDLGVPIVGVGLLYRSGYFAQSLSREGWQQERYPVLDPDGLPISLLREADGEPAQGRRSACPAGAHLVAQVWKAQVGRVPLLLLDSDVEDNEPGRARRHRPALRRRQRAPAAPGDAARHRRRPRAARVLPAHRCARRPSVPHQRGPRRLPRPRAHPRADRGPRAVLRRGPRGGPRRHALHHPHPGARRHRPVRPRPGRPALRRRQRGPGRPGRARPGARRRGLRGRRPAASSTWR